MKSLLIKLSLLITYFGDYCSLIGIMEYAKQFGHSEKVVAIFIAYCLPPLIMLLVSKRWADHQREPTKQMTLFCGLGMVSVLSLLWTHSYGHVLLVTLLLGFSKEAIQVLKNVFIKQNFPEEEAKKTLRDVVTIRFVVMILGGSLGGYLGAAGMFKLIFCVDAFTYLVSGVMFLFVTSVATKTITDSEGSGTWKQICGMTQVFGAHPFNWFFISALAIGVFMALEYPLITTELGISPKFMGVIYSGHVVGALLAGKASKYFFNSPNPRLLISGLALTLIGAFAMVGAMGSGLFVISLQIGLIAFLMVALEVHSQSWLMQRSSNATYPHYNLYFSIVRRFATFLGSLVPLLMLSGFSLQQTNIISNGSLMILGAIVSLGLIFLVFKRGNYELST